MGDRVDKAFDKDTSYRTLELVNSWITAADSKSSILLAFIALLVGLTSNSYSKIVDVMLNGNNISITFGIVIAVLYLIVLILVIYHLILVFTARLKTGNSIDHNNLVSFISISNMTDQKYLELVKKTTDEEICEMILKQVNVNSKIAYQKMKQFNKALLYSFILIPITIILVTVSGWWNDIDIGFKYVTMVFTWSQPFKDYSKFLVIKRWLKICFFGFSAIVSVNIKHGILMLFEYIQDPIFEQYGALNARGECCIAWIKIALWSHQLSKQ